ncbi:SDR family NAD(P)-dependent oxidoreductase [Pontiella sp.]|uniref:SDR family NAD(P)-dependent oxidoreductase n=1 Tax=Pontiella sp. TaxID=2837462 RepID=UPI0035631083
MKSKTVIITGANSGIGKAAARRIAAQGHRVVLACRNPERALAAAHEIEGDCIVARIDLSSRRSIQDFTDWAHRELDGIDVLINHAADFDLSSGRREMTPDGFERIWFTNHLGPVLLTDRLLDMLVAARQGRVLNVSSAGLFMHPFLTVNLKDPMFNHRPFSAAKAYYQSKLAQAMHAQWLAQQLSGTMTTANCICAGNVRIDLDRFPELPQWKKNLYAIKALFAIAPEQLAETYARAALDLEVRNLTGKQLGYPFKEKPFSAYEKDPLCIEQVMNLTYRQLGILPSISFEPAESLR